ncbi:MAG: response regulator [Solirubrobacterales bacterium]|nr:response regulator [Solirubrobacterales bacterium]
MTELIALADGLRAILETNKDDFQRRVTTLEQAVAAVAAGSLHEQLRASAQRDAHKLAGSLGTFGLPRGSDLARELEQRFALPGRPVQSDGEHLANVVGALRGELDAKLADRHPDALDPGGVTRGALVDVTDIARQASDDRELRRAMFETGLAGTEQIAPSSRRILVVDDDPPVRLALAAILADAGYDIRDVGSAREARHVLTHETIDLLLSDVSMPGETGIDLIRYALCEHRETATLLISALEDPGIAQVAMDFGAYGYLSKPVRRTEVLIGVMNALRRRDIEARERATRENLERVVALRTSALSDALQRVEAAATQGRVLQAETIHRWAQSAENREPGIARHVKRVSHYCALLGHAFGLHAESLGLASVLHDVGKLAIPDSILLKPGPLTADERLAIETHAQIGYDMLSGSCSSLLDMAAVIARTHHEKFDGSGYPRGLAGTDIPLEGRIAAVADVFDALTSDRVYRPGWTVQATITSMRSERDKHFDPVVLEAFISSIDEVQAVRSGVRPR